MIETLVQTWNDLRDFVFVGGSAGLEVTRSHSWPWGPSVTLVLVATAAAWVIYVYAHERGRAGVALKAFLASLRILLILLLVFLLYGWMLNRHRTDLPDLVLLLDDSASMATVDEHPDAAQQAELVRRLQASGLSQAGRLDLAKLLLLEGDANLLRQLQQRYRLKVYSVGGAARPLAGVGASPAASPTDPAAWIEPLRRLEAGEPASRLGKGLQDVLAIQRGRPTAALIMLTDGVTTEGKTISEAASEARRKAVPLFLVGLGNSRPPRDVRVADLLVDDVVFAGDLVHFDCKVFATGYEGQPATVRLTVQGRDGPALAEQPLTLGKDGVPESVRLSYRPTDKGDFESVVAVLPLDRETNADNNRQTRVVKVRDDALPVLYVQA